MADPGILSGDDLAALLARVDQLMVEVRAMNEAIAQALAENRRRDQQRVAPETHTAARTRPKYQT